MNYQLSLTQKQPPEWERKTLRECFGLIPRKKGEEIEAIAGDVIISHGGPGNISAHMAQDGEKVKPACIIARPNGTLRSEVLVSILSQPGVARQVTEAMSMASSVGIRHPAKLGGIELAIPPAHVQENIVKTFESSTRLMDEHIANMQQALAILAKFSIAIEREVLLGQMDRKQATLMVAQVLRPWLAGVSAEPSPDKEKAPEEPAPRAPGPRPG